jgi:biopolymer transport protein ExbD
MVTLKRRQRSEAEIPTASMSDISFLLLLFFLVTTTIDVDTGIGMTLPEYIPIEEQTKVPVSKERMAALLVNENGDVLLDGKGIAIPQIAKTLKPRIQSKIELPSNKKLIVSVKTDRKTNYNLYIKTLDQVKQAFQEVRDEYSNSTYGMKYTELDQVQGDQVREKVPVIISIAEPEVVK